MPIKKWTLLSKTDVSPSSWFPIENRVYRMPNGQIVDDFTITTLADVSLIIPITTDGQIVMARQYKPGVDDILLQFPGGRTEPHHRDLTQTAQEELHEELGISVESDQLTQFAQLTGFSTKATEIVYFFVAENCEVNSHQRLDQTEEIEPVFLSPAEVDQKIANQEIWCAPTVAGWFMAKQKFPALFSGS